MAQADKERWLVYQAPPESPFDRLYYSSPVRGISSEATDQRLAYWGLTFSRTPAATPPHQLGQEFKHLAAALPSSLVVLPDGVAECYEFWDLDTGERAALWRIPLVPALVSDPAQAPSQVPDTGVDLEPWSAHEGVMQQATQQSIVYWGRMRRVPHEVMEQRDAQRKRSYEQNPDELARAAVQRGVVVIKGVLERYEAWDVYSEDLLILWRLPCRTRP